MIVTILKTEKIHSQEELQQRLKQEGIFVGMSSGAAMYAAAEFAKQIDSGMIVVIFPDRGEKYLSTKLFPKH